MASKAESKPLRIGTLGASRIAPAALINPARDNDGVEVAAVAARDRARAEQYARKYGIPVVHETYEDLIADPALEAIYNPLPNSLHAEWTIRALQASLFSSKLLAIWLKVEGTEGSLYARNPLFPQRGFSRLKVSTAAGTRTENFSKPSTYEEQLVAFVALVREGTAVPTDGWDGVRNMQVIDAIYRAAGMEVRGAGS